MQLSQSARFGAYIIVTLSAALLSACGGGGASAGGTDGTVSLASITTGHTPAPATVTPTTPVTTSPISITPTTPDNSAATTVTDVRLQNTGTAQTNVPFTFGQIFAVGSVKPTDTLNGRLDDGSIVALQMDVKATHADGSVRHAVISGVLPTLAVNAERKLDLQKKSGTTTAAAATTTGPSALSSNNFNFSVHAKIGGVDYFASADELLKTKTPAVWLKGAVANEWLVSAPLHNSAGAEHPHLTARFAVRWFESVKKARVDVTVENAWAFEGAPQNFTYDAQVISGGQPVYAATGLTHYHHARWRKTFWWNGSEPQVNVKLNTNYLINTRAVPNYDQNVVAGEGALNDLKASWDKSGTQPMNIGLATYYMPMTGAHLDIGIMPSWTTIYLLSMDQRAKQATLGTADLAGTWSMHYRDKKTDRPVSLVDYPYMTILGRYGDTWNPSTNKMEAFPGCAADGLCNTPYTHDSAHQPNFAYLPYLVTGDYYYLEELQFWAMYNSFASNPNYRQFAQGLFQDGEVRAQAWNMRTAAEAAYITPDTDVLKTQLVAIVNNNLDWYNSTFTGTASTANALGVITSGYAYSYDGNNGIAPWQDDFFTSAIGHTMDLGFTKAKTLLDWKVKFPIMRMVGQGACWIDGGKYSMVIRASNNSPVFGTIGEVYQASHAADFNTLACGSQAMASYLNLKVGEMTGFSDSTMGYPSNMQPALAYAADVGGTAGKQAWNQLMARTVKVDYSSTPQFNIIPR